MDSSAFLKNLAAQEAGQGLTEYSLILGSVVFSVWLLLSVSGIGDGITHIFAQVASTVAVTQ